MWKCAPRAFLLIALAGSPVLAAAGGLKRGEPKDIDFLLGAASGKNSAYMAEYIGSANGKSYIVYRSAVNASSLFAKDMNHVVFWFPDDELPEPVVDKFLGYKHRSESLRAQHGSNQGKETGAR